MKLSRILLTSLLLGLFPSCVKTEVINAHLEQVDSVVLKKPHKPLSPPIESDTTRVQIGFNPIVSDWEDTEIDI